MNFRRIVLSFLLFFLVVPMGVALVPERVNAAVFGLVPCALKNDDQSTADWDERGPCTICHFMIGFQRIISLLRNIMTAIAIAVIVAMAIVYITSAGDEGRMSFAKEGIKWSLIGFVVILLAWVIVNFLFTMPIFANNGLVSTSWDTFSCNTTSQVGWQASKPSSGIGNSSGSTSNAPNRYGLPGATPNTGGTGGSVLKPRCGATHYTCAVGTVSGTQELTDRWSWLCQGQESYNQQYCFERFEGCGDGNIDAGEVCDMGGSNGLCNSGDERIICNMNTCTRCDGVTSP